MTKKLIKITPETLSEFSERLNKAEEMLSAIASGKTFPADEYYKALFGIRFAAKVARELIEFGGAK